MPNNWNDGTEKYNLNAKISKLESQLDAANVEIAELRASILNIRGDDLCWIREEIVQIPPAAEFFESCRRFHAQVAKDVGVLQGSKTIAQLEKEATELRMALRESLKLQAHYGRLLNAHDGGSRLIFETMDEWLERLRRIRA